MSTTPDPEARMRAQRAEVAAAVHGWEMVASYALPISAAGYIVQGADVALRRREQRAALISAARRSLEIAESDVDRRAPDGPEHLLRRAAFFEAAALRLAA